MFGISYYQAVTRIGHFQRKLSARSRLKVQLGNSENHKLFHPEQRLETDLETNALLPYVERKLLSFSSKNSLAEYTRVEYPPETTCKSVGLRRWSSKPLSTVDFLFCWMRIVQSTLVSAVRKRSASLELLRLVYSFDICFMHLFWLTGSNR